MLAIGCFRKHEDPNRLGAWVNASERNTRKVLCGLPYTYLKTTLNPHLPIFLQFLFPSFLLVILPSLNHLFAKYFFEHFLCARHHTELSGYRGEYSTGEFPALTELLV